MEHVSQLGFPYTFKVDANSYSFALGVVYWYIWTIAIPRWRGTKLEEETQVLEDGTTVTKLRYQ